MDTCPMQRSELSSRVLDISFSTPLEEDLHAFLALLLPITVVKDCAQKERSVSISIFSLQYDSFLFR